MRVGWSDESRETSEQVSRPQKVRSSAEERATTKRDEPKRKNSSQKRKQIQNNPNQNSKQNSKQTQPNSKANSKANSPGHPSLVLLHSHSQPCSKAQRRQFAPRVQARNVLWGRDKYPAATASPTLQREQSKTQTSCQSRPPAQLKHSIIARIPPTIPAAANPRHLTCSCRLLPGLNWP